MLTILFLFLSNFKDVLLAIETLKKYENVAEFNLNISKIEVLYNYLSENLKLYNKFTR